MLNFKTFYFVCCMFISSVLIADYEDQALKCEFLCDLEEKTTSSIILVGERHYSKSADKMNDMLKSLACMGDIYLAAEGKPAGKNKGFDLDATCGKGKTKKALIYGLENELSIVFVTALDSYFYLVYDLKHNNDYQTILKRKLGFILAIGPNGILQDAWKRVSTDNKHRFPKFITLLDEYIVMYEKENDIPKDFVLQLMADINFMNNEKAFVELSKAFAREVGIKVQEALEFSGKELGSFFDLLEDPFNLYNQEQVADFAVRYRDIVMARNLAKLFCKAQPTGKLLYAQVGQKHLAGIKAYLIEASGGKVKVKELDLTKE